MEGYQNLLSENRKVKVSSVLNNNTVENGKDNMFDGNDDTSWYSNEGKFQYICLFFDKPSEVKEIQITSSGGFCPKVLTLFIFMK